MRSAAGIVLVLSMAFLLTSRAARAQEEEPGSLPHLEFSGYLKDLSTFEFGRSIDSATTGNLLHNRLMLRLSITNEISAHLHARTRLFYGEEIERTPNPAQTIGADPGRLDLSVIWVNSHSLFLQTIADRAYLQYATPEWDVRLGRQRVNWGINTIWNPNDIFNAYNFLDFDYEERPGSDAARVSYLIDPHLSVEAAGALEKNGIDPTAAALLKWNIGGYDLQFLAGKYRSDAVGGLGFAGNLWDAGLKGELSYFSPSDSGKGVASASATLDYTIGTYYVALSGLYSSAATEAPISPAALLTAAPSPKLLMPFPYTAYLGVSKSFTPVFMASAAIIYSPTFHSTILFPTVSYSLAENVDADLTIESFFNDASGVYAAEVNAFFLRVRWSF